MVHYKDTLSGGSIRNRHFQGDFVESLGGIFFKKYTAVQHFHPALDIFKAQPYRTFVHSFEIRLGNSFAIVVQTDVEFTITVVLGKVNKAGIAVLEDVVDQLLCHTENQQVSLWKHSLTVVMKTAACIDGARSTDFLEKVIDRRLQTKVL